MEIYFQGKSGNFYKATNLRNFHLNGHHPAHLAIDSADREKTEEIT